MHNSISLILIKINSNNIRPKIVRINWMYFRVFRVEGLIIRLLIPNSNKVQIPILLKNPLF
jgi:hypothetical protein